MKLGRSVISFLALAAALCQAAPAGEKASASGKRYLLLLYEDARYQTARGEALSARIEEYRNWSRRTPGVESGDKLSGNGWKLTSTGAAPMAANPRKGFVAGLFIIEAAGDEEALRTARGCPHLTHGGEIELRPID